MTTTEQKRRTDGFLGCEGGPRVSGGGGTCGGASNKRVKIGCAGAAAAGEEVSSCVKVKKDKIGERVGALQQLVSPFGKTDTASVLQEATAYIKFLHEQLQVLSAPYIGSTQTGEPQGSENYNLRNRGLCLVPMACTLGIARSNGADIWAPVSANRPPGHQISRSSSSSSSSCVYEGKEFLNARATASLL